MELLEPRSKPSKFRLEPKSSLPLVFGNKGELTKFHANLTALGSCIADPVEIQMIHKMGYFGKGSLSKSQPSFGKLQHGAPLPVIRARQWQRRQQWISDVQKLSATTFGESSSSTNTNRNDEQSAAKNKKDTSSLDKEHEVANEIEIVDCEAVQPPLPQVTSANGQDSKTDMVIDDDDDDDDEVVQLDSTGEEDDDETSIGLSYFNKDYFSNENCNLIYASNNHNSNKYNRDSNSDLQLQQGQILVLSDSDDDDDDDDDSSHRTDDYLVNIRPEIKLENFPVRETLHLTAEETFFLMYGLGCLRVVDFEGEYLSIEQIWNYFCKEQPRFLQKYITYHYLRSKGWIVKPGLVYGGDYLLYKEGPPFYHSSYIVIIDVLDAVTSKRIESKSMRSGTWNSLIGLQRLAETVRKEILLAQVLWPASVPLPSAVDDTSNSTILSPEVLSQFTVKEILWRRWKLSINTFDDDDDYSDEDNYSS